MEYYDREKLYAEVWAETLTRVAARYGVSAVALGKVCRKLKVPLPGRGYWAKKAHGHSVRQTPLLKATDVRPIARLKSPEVPEPLATVAESPELVRIAQVEPRLQAFSASGDKIHPSVLRARKVLSKFKPDERYILRMAESGCLDIRVTEGAMGRALALMKALIGMAESEGFAVIADSKQRETMHFCAYDEKIEFSLTEKVHQVELESPRPRQKPDGSWYPTYAGKPIDYEPTGELCIEVRNYWSGGLRKTWRDSQKRRLEELLPECLIGLLKIALVTHREMEQRRQQEIARQKKREEMLELQKQIEAETKRVQQLQQNAMNWHTARLIRDYVEAVIIKARAENKPVGPDTEIGKWILWAKEQADRFDPISASPASVLDRRSEIGPWL